MEENGVFMETADAEEGDTQGNPAGNEQGKDPGADNDATDQIVQQMKESEATKRPSGKPQVTDDGL